MKEVLILLLGSAIALLVVTLIVLGIYATGQMYYQRCETMGFKAGSIKNYECVRILSGVPGEYQRELLDSLRDGK